MEVPLRIVVVFVFAARCYSHPTDASGQNQPLQIRLNISATAETGDPSNQGGSVGNPVLTYDHVLVRPVASELGERSSLADKSDRDAKAVSLDLPRLASALKSVEGNAEAAGGDAAAARVAGMMTEKFVDGVGAEDTNSLRDYISKLLLAAEAVRLSEDQTKRILPNNLKGTLRKIAKIMTDRGVPLKSCVKFMLALTMEETNMGKFVRAFDSGLVSGVISDALDQLKELVHLIMNEEVLKDVSENMGNQVKTDVFILALGKILPDAYLDQFSEKDFTIENVIQNVLSESDPNLEAWKAVFMINQKYAKSKTTDVGIEELLEMHVGFALGQDGTDMKNKIQMPKISSDESEDAESGYDESYESDEASYYDEDEEEEDYSEESSESNKNKMNEGIVIAGRSGGGGGKPRKPDEDHEKQNAILDKTEEEESGSKSDSIYVDALTYVVEEVYHEDEDGDASSSGEEEYYDESYGNSYSDEEEEEDYLPPIEEVISDSSEESEKLDELYDKLVDTGHL